MDPAALIVAVIVVAAIIVVLRRPGANRQPKPQPFRCARCSTASMHTARTLEAKQRGKRKFFCNSCHGEWLRTQPSNPKPVQGGSRRNALARAGRSGCLGAVILAVGIPAVAAFFYLSM